MEYKNKLLLFVGITSLGIVTSLLPELNLRGLLGDVFTMIYYLQPTYLIQFIIYRPFYWNEELTQYQWFVRPIIKIIINMLFGLVAVYLINRYVNYLKRDNRKIKDYLKITKLGIFLIIFLVSYGLIISSFNDARFFLLNPGAMTIGALASMSFFFDKSLYRYEWFTHPLFMIISNLIFWIPTAIIINRYVEKRHANSSQSLE